MKTPTISVIIPMYNSEKYICKNINSILNQSFTDFELIIVNDSSTDKSLNAVKSFNDKRISVYTKINEGPSKARNYGIKHAKGKYIMFIDADDYIEPNALSTYMDIIKNSNPDFIINGFYSETINSDYADMVCLDSKLYNSKKELKEDLVLLYKNHLLYNVWNKLFKMDIIKNNKINFKDVVYNEDMIFVQDYLKCCHKVYNTNECLYHYVREIKGSITMSFIPNLLNIRINENKILANFLGTYGIKKNEYADFIAKRYMERTLGCLENVHRTDYWSLKDKIRETDNIIHCKETRYYLDIYKTNNKIIKIILKIYKLKSPLPAFFIGFLFHFFKSFNPSLFNKIKNKR